MTIKVKLGQLYQQNSALDTLLRASVPAKTAYQLSKMTKQIAEEVQDVEKQRLALIDKYGEVVQEEGQPESKRVPQANIQSFMAEFEELLQQEVELYGDKISLDKLEGVNISAADMLSLDWLIEA